MSEETLSSKNDLGEVCSHCGRARRLCTYWLGNEIERLRAEIDHINRYWQQFYHYPKGSPDETTTTHPDTARLDWILQDYRGVDLYNALDGQIGVCTDNLNEIRAAIDKMIAKDSAAEKASVRHWEMPCQICGAHRGADGEIRHLPSCELSVNGNGDV